MTVNMLQSYSCLASCLQLRAHIHGICGDRYYGVRVLILGQHNPFISPFLWWCGDAGIFLYTGIISPPPPKECHRGDIQHFCNTPNKHGTCAGTCAGQSRGQDCIVRQHFAKNPKILCPSQHAYYTHSTLLREDSGHKHHVQPIFHHHNRKRSCCINRG